MYSLEQFVVELRRTRAECKDEREMLSRVRSLAPKLALSKGWVRRTHYEADPEQGFGVHVLQEEPDARPVARRGDHAAEGLREAAVGVEPDRGVARADRLPEALGEVVRVAAAGGALEHDRQRLRVDAVVLEARAGLLVLLPVADGAPLDGAPQQAPRARAARRSRAEGGWAGFYPARLLIKVA